MARTNSRPRIVFVTRPTWLEELLERHGTLGQAEFYLKSRGQTIDRLVEAHELFYYCLIQVRQELPSDQRQTSVGRDGLDRFLFAPDDVVVIVGQDGLVPNTAKYLRGQLTIGINPDPARIEGILCPHTAPDMANLLNWLEEPDNRYFIQSRSMARALREDGQELLALNEIFIGHRSHQSARYRLSADGETERQSSSGIICSTGTGATGWAVSIATQCHCPEPMPLPGDDSLIWFVREPWPSISTGTELSNGIIRPGKHLAVESEMAHGGVIFADGIESDNLEFLEGHRVLINKAGIKLNLVMPASALADRTQQSQ